MLGFRFKQQVYLFMKERESLHRWKIWIFIKFSNICRNFSKKYSIMLLILDNLIFMKYLSNRFHQRLAYRPIYQLLSELKWYWKTIFVIIGLNFHVLEESLTIRILPATILIRTSLSAIIHFLFWWRIKIKTKLDESCDSFDNMPISI